ncbi:hypothetical protein [Allorhizocola rhizosphaerae]|uniref:hypothetical protein n=1 Tax=Allorhizocola rhizosphaerae TaxID=1872709 RepID=UPI000E3C98FE|nr:hypothetical protein [Allorhizocola rhizosphaerae]
MADVTLGLASGPGESTVLSVKLQMPAWELNLRATPEELAGLRAIRGSDWAARRSLHIGQSAGSPVHWAMAEAGTAAVMVGADDETWDFAVMVPLASVDRIVAAVAAGEW